MQIEQFKLLLHSNTDWLISPKFPHPAILKNSNYLNLLCKNCGTKKKHSVGNLKYTIFNNKDHSRCHYCVEQERKSAKSQLLLSKAKKHITEHKDFPWLLDTDKLDPSITYTHKTLLPLICKQCGAHKHHSYNNISTAIFINPKHICCQACKQSNSWENKVKKATPKKFEINKSLTFNGHRVVHKECGNYHYIDTFHELKNATCPFCNDNSTTLKKLKDLESLKKFIHIKTDAKLILHERNKDILLVSCTIHPEDGKYPLSWKSFRISNRQGKTYNCKACKNQQLRTTFHFQYNEKISQLGLEINIPTKESKISLKDQLLHHCSTKPHHPPFYASPYEVLLKNKRCLFCNSHLCYQKGYLFIKTFIEMDRDRFYSHAGRQFRLLSSQQEIETQLQNKRIADLILRVNELTCLIHDEYHTTWASFFYNGMACSKCSRDNRISYAHAYYQTLLEYFNQEYIPEYPIKINNKKNYRIDFKLKTLPQYVEIDSNLHTSKNGWDNQSIKSYQKRDKQKNKHLGENLERIKLYDSFLNVLPINDQLLIIEEAFIRRAKANGLINITSNAITLAKEDPAFFKSSRIIYFIRRLFFFHGTHIIFNDNKHINLLQSIKEEKVTFYCNVHKTTFIRNPKSVLKLHFICPICVEHIKYEFQESYLMNTSKIEEIQKVINSRFKNEFNINLEKWGTKVYTNHTIVFPVYSNTLKAQVYIAIRHLLTKPVTQLIKALKNGEYNFIRLEKLQKKGPYPKKNRNLLPITINYISNKQRKLLHPKCEEQLQAHQVNAKEINRIMRNKKNEENIENLILQNEKKLKRYVHITNIQALLSLALYDRKIHPFFESIKTHKLLTSREKYAHSKQLLLIKDLSCGHQFYISWNWLIYRQKKINDVTIQCQHQSCYGSYYQQRHPGPRKVPHEDILAYFTSLYNSQYYPLAPEQTIKVREVINVVHLPSGKPLRISVDNFGSISISV